MCIPKGIAIGVFGGVCTGKSTFVAYMAKKYGFPVRHCGDCVRMVAEAQHVAVRELSHETHRRIDEETIQWIRDTHGTRLVEGRYLQYVLANETIPVILFRFISRTDIRAIRWTTKASVPHAVGDVVASDLIDQKFCEHMYNSTMPMDPAVTVETTTMSVEELERRFVEWKWHDVSRQHD